MGRFLGRAVCRVEAGVVLLGLCASALAGACQEDSQRDARATETPSTDGGDAGSDDAGAGGGVAATTSAGGTSGGVAATTSVGGASGVGGSEASTSSGGLAGGEPSIGGNPAVADGGSGGEAWSPGRPIVVHIVSGFFGGPVAGIVVLINGERFKSDADGIVHAHPAGPYQAIIFDTETVPSHRYPVEVWEGLNDDAPTFSVLNSVNPYDTSPRYMSGELGGPYPADAELMVGVRNGSSKQIFGSNSFLLELVQAEWGGGTVVGLARAGAAFWFGQQPFTRGPYGDYNIGTLPLAPVGTQSIDVNFVMTPGLVAKLGIGLGPLPVYSTEVTASTQLTYDVPAGPAVTAAELPLAVWLRCESPGPALSISTNAVGVEPGIETPDVSCADLVDLDPPPSPATAFERDTPFTFKPDGPACTSLNLISGKYEITVHTAAQSISLPNLEEWGIKWPGSGRADTVLSSSGPCAAVTTEQSRQVPGWGTYSSTTVRLSAGD